MDYIIREMKENEWHMLKDFTYEAIFQRDENNPIPRDDLEQPTLRVFYEDFGKPDDLCFVAVSDGQLVGAVWTRIISGDIKGFGNVDEHTPEFGVSLYKEWRGKGIGTALMRRMLAALKERGYTQTSLAVQTDNYAVKMYESVGFYTVKKMGEEYLMVCDLTKYSALD